MGVLNRRDVFTSKFPTALIIDASNRIFFVAIKHILGGNYFLVELENQLYVFKLDGSRILTYRHTLSKTFNLYIYSIDHYSPISPMANELTTILKEHNLPKINSHLLSFFRLLSLREKKKEEFTPHDVVAYVEKLKEGPDNPEIANLVTYIESLNLNKIVLPLRKVSEFLESDLLTTDSKFLGNLVLTLQSLDFEHRKVTNTPITGKKPILKMVAIMMIVMLVVALAYIGYEQGVFDRLLSSVPGLGSGGGGLFSGTTDPSESILSQYPDPVDLKIAIDNGEVDYDSLPKTIQNLVDGVELPEVETESPPAPQPERTPPPPEPQPEPEPERTPPPPPPVEPAPEPEPQPAPEPEPIEEEPVEESNVIDDINNFRDTIRGFP